EDLFTRKETGGGQSEFVITYAGSIADFYHPEAFIDALKNALQQNPGIPVKLRFVGVLSEGIKNYIFKSGLGHILEEIGYVPHKESIRYLLKSTVLLLVNPVTKDEEMVIPGKVYEYLAAQKPIINITRSTAESAMLIERCGAGQTFERNMQPQIEQHLSSLFTRWMQEKNLDIKNNDPLIRVYSRGAITGELIAVLEKDG
ncbi:MAG TPA: hypothetical protein VGB46_08765, partial [Flavisolibacter sp.]